MGWEEEDGPKDKRRAAVPGKLLDIAVKNK
jgi:hypothetical protein